MIKVGQIGAGRWGKNHLRVLSELHKLGFCELVGFVDPEEKSLAEEYRTGYFCNYEEILSLIDAVLIVTPTDTHYNIAKKCLLEGKHVFVEKPLTMDSGEAEELVKIAERKELVLATGYQYRFNKAVIKLREEMKRVGDIHYITMRYIHSSKPPRKDMGVIFNFGSHLIDTLNFLLEQLPKRIFCKKANYFSDEREDYAAILLDYGDFVVSLEVSWLHPLKKRDCWVIASKEKIYADFLEQKLTKYFIEISPGNVVNRGFEEVRIEAREPLKEEIKHFIMCIEEGKEPLNNGKAGYIATKLCELALKSAEKYEEVEVNDTLI